MRLKSCPSRWRARGGVAGDRGLADVQRLRADLAGVVHAHQARGVAAVAMDCFPEKPFWRMTLLPAERGANHKRWLKAGIPMIQLLTNLGSIGGRFKLVALPLRLRGMDGSPARVVGIEE